MARALAAAEPRILLFVPMYNCERQIGRVIAQLTPEAQERLDEVIVVDNRSLDASREKAAKALSALTGVAARVLQNDDNYGLGGSHKVAFNYAIEHRFDYCIVLHGDDQGSIADLLGLIAAGEHRRSDCLLGSRFMPGATLPGYSPFRTLGNRVFNRIYSAVSGVRIHDLGAGLNIYAVAALQDRFYLRCPDDLTFNYHMILRSIAAGWRLRFFPLEWREDDQVSNVKLVRQALRVAGLAIRFAIDRRGYLASGPADANQRTYGSKVVFETGAAAR